MEISRRKRSNNDQHISGTNRGDKRFWFTGLDKKSYEISGTYYLSNFLQILKYADDSGKDTMKALEIAVASAKILKLNYNKEWETIAKKMYIPYDPEKKYNPTYEDAPLKSQGSVAILLQYPLEMSQGEAVIRNNLNYAIDDLKKRGSGVMMGVTFIPIIAAELNDETLFNQLVPETYEHNLRPPFNAITETPDNMNYNFLTGAGGFLQQVIFGYTGLRITDDGLKGLYKPVLPEGVTQLELKNFKYRGITYNFIVQNGKLEKIRLK